MGDRIFGLGCDIVDVSRIQTLMEDKSAAFIGRVLTQLEEVEYKKRQLKSTSRGVLYLCTRFAAKEAFSKALGCGVGKDFSFQDLSVLNNEAGQPVLQYSDKLGQWMADNKACAKVSLSDERLYAMATVILFTRDDN